MPGRGDGVWRGCPAGASQEARADRTRGADIVRIDAIASTLIIEFGLSSFFEPTSRTFVRSRMRFVASQARPFSFALFRQFGPRDDPVAARRGALSLHPSYKDAPRARRTRCRRSIRTDRPRSRRANARLALARLRSPIAPCVDAARPPASVDQMAERKVISPYADSRADPRLTPSLPLSSRLSSSARLR